MFNRNRHTAQHRPDSRRERLALSQVPETVADIPKGITMGAQLLLTRQVALQHETNLGIKTQESNAKDIDAKTGLLTYSAWKTRVEQRLQHHRLNDIETHILLIDADHFKRINDQFGHLWGDAALYMFGSAVRSGLKRREDSAGVGENKYEDEDAGRFGGEEIVTALFNTDTNGALVVAERIREDIGTITFASMTEAVERNDGTLPENLVSILKQDQGGTTWNDLVSSEESLSVSIGIGMIGVGSTDLEAGLQEADTALYRAKALGRAQTVAFSQLPAGSGFPYSLE